jgi:hypothetical protein
MGDCTTAVELTAGRMGSENYFRVGDKYARNVPGANGTSTCSAFIESYPA